MKILFIVLGIVVLVIIVGMIRVQRTSRPELGIQEGKLLPLPNKPNCVATQSGNSTQRMEPIPYSGDRETAQNKLLQILNQLPRTTLIKNEPKYIRIVFRSAFFGFPDDVEFLFDKHTIHFRAAARLGHSDFGVNRKRMDNITHLFEK
jgi:uncharacterized protein (DUF1499 family)